VFVCFMLFVSFIAIGVVIATLFGRRSERIGRLYFADLVGAGLACAIVVVLLGWIGPPATILLAGVVLAFVGIKVALEHARPGLGSPAAGSRSCCSSASCRRACFPNSARTRSRTT
jgi:hypothetical protein